MSQAFFHLIFFFTGYHL